MQTSYTRKITNAVCARMQRSIYTGKSNFGLIQLARSAKIETVFSFLWANVNFTGFAEKPSP